MIKIKNFILGCQAELKKVVWPTKDEQIGATWIVIISVALLSIFLYAVDFLYFHIMKSVFAL